MADRSRTTNQVHGHVSGYVVQATTVELVAGARPPVAVTGLPPTVPAFVGRHAELSRLDGLLRDPGSEEQPRGGVTVIAGLAGVGKTALALAVAHRARRAGWFPGGVLMIDMFGYDPPDRQVRPEQALGSVLGNLGVAGEHIPADGPGRERLWRSILAERAAAGQRMLIIVDNVSSSAQVRPLLPGLSPHEALITSRHTLSDIEAAALIRLAVLSSEEATSLLCQQLTGADAADQRGTTQTTHAARIAEMCGGLPLAIRIAGALLAADLGQPLSEMAGTLADERSRLEELSYDGSFAVRSAFDLSYRQLEPADARLFRLLALHQGPEFTSDMVDVVLGEQRRGSLGRLHRANLIEAGSDRGRWRMHDLVRLYAQELVAAEDDRAVVARRIGEHYLAVCSRAQRRLDTPARTPADNAEIGSALSDVDLALTNVTAAVVQAHDLGHDDLVVQLAESMFTYFDLRKCWDAWTHIDQVALASAQRMNDEHAASRIRVNLGIALRDLGRFDEAIAAFHQALSFFLQVADSRREAEARNSLAVVLRKCGRLDDALAELRLALAVWDRLGDALGQTRALNNMGLVHSTSGSYAQAVDSFARALVLVPSTGDERRRAKVLHNFGVVCLRQGRYVESTSHLEQALEIRRNLGDRYRAAKTLAMLGAVLLELHRREEGTAKLREALAVFRAVGDQRWADKVVAQLAACAERRPV